jgi:hypothetical protein
MDTFSEVTNKWRRFFQRRHYRYMHDFSATAAILAQGKTSAKQARACRWATADSPYDLSTPLDSRLRGYDIL